MKLNPLLFLLLAAGTARAQTSPIITMADMPAATDSLRLSQASILLPASAPPLSRSGANQTWNYAGLVATSQRLARYSSPGDAAGFLIQFTFNSALSPDTRATVAMPRSLPIPDGTAIGVTITDPLEFFATSATDFRSVGFSATISGTAVPVTYTSRAQQDVIYRFPLSYGSAAAVSNSLLTTPAALASSGSFSQQRQRTTQPDAWGTLTTPFGTFQTVRVVSQLLDYDVVSVGGGPEQGLTLPLTREYKWLATGVHVPVLTIITAEAAGQEIVTSVEYRDRYRRFGVLAARDAATEAGLNASPNPSAVGAALRLAVPVGSGPLRVVGADLLGRQLFERSFGSSAGGVLTLDAAAFGSYRGVVLLTVHTSQGTATRRVVRE